MKCFTLYSALISQLVLQVLIFPDVVFAGDKHQQAQLDKNISEYSDQRALNPGESIYMNGILSDGSKMNAFVQDDIPVNGQIFSCVLCHRRSGLGTSEGFVVTLPVNSLNLFRSRVLWDTRRRHSQPGSSIMRSRQVPANLLGKSIRPAYTDKSLAKVIRTGIDSAGRKLNGIMPRYDLEDHEMALLINYLKTLSHEFSPGVTNQTLRFATIVTEGVSKRDRDAMLDVLKTHINDRNSQTRNQIKRARVGAFNRRELDAAYRILELSVWELTGPEDTWRQQLEKYISNKPVFAVLGGITGGHWASIHKFSEEHSIPVVFPVTDQPVLSDKNRNTIYFSKGLYQEGAAAARFIRRYQYVTDKTHLIQIYIKGSKGEVVANGFTDTWRGLSSKVEYNYEIQDIDQLNDEFYKTLMDSENENIILFWIADKEISSIKNIVRSGDVVDRIFVSSRLLQDKLYSISDALRDSVYVTYPYSLPGEKKRTDTSLKTWLGIKGITLTNYKIQSQMYYLGWVLSDALAGLKGEFYRNYFLERIEMMKDQSHTVSTYPRLSLGPDQRYASKGCYIVQLGKGEEEKLIKKSNWIIH